MRKSIILGTVLLFLFAIVLVAFWNLNSLVNQSKNYLLEQAERRLGRKVTVDHIAVTLWGGIGLRLDRFAMSDDPSFSSDSFIQAEDLRVHVKLLPLLRRDVQVKRLVLHNPVIKVIRNREGKYNFSTIGKDTIKPKGAAKEQSSSERGGRAPTPFLIALVNVSGGDLHYLDQKDGTEFQAKQIDFSVKDFDLNRPFSAEFLAALFSGKQNLKLNMKIGPIGPQVSLDNVPIEGNADIDPLDFGKLKSALPALRAMLPSDLDLIGVLKVKSLHFNGTLKQLALKGTLDATAADVIYRKALRKDRGIPLVVSTDAQFADNVIRLGQTKIKLSTLELTGAGEVKLGVAPLVNLSLTSNRFSLEGWEKMFPPIRDYQLSGNLDARATLKGRIGKGAFPAVEGVVHLVKVSAKPPQFPKPIRDLNSTINFSGDKAELKDSMLSLGNARVRLAGQIDRFSPLTLSYKLSTPAMWPADFQASLSEDRKSDVIKDLSAEGALMANGESLMIQANLTSTQGTLHRINYKDLATSLVLENKSVKVRNLRLGVLGGSVLAEGEYAFNSATPRFSLASKAERIDLGELYRSLDSERSRDIQGRLNGDMSVAGTGKDWNEIKPSLRGQGQAEVSDGALLDFNLADAVLSGITGIPGLTSLINPQVRKKYPETFEAKDTKFKELKGLFDLAGGRMNVKALRIAATDYTVQGDGWVDFEKRVNFHAVLLLSQQLSADLGRSAREVTYAFNTQNQFELPFSLTGTLPRVNPKPDAGYLGKLVQRGFLRKGAEELQQRLFGKERSVAPAENAAPTSPSDQKKEKRKNSTEELIRKGLDQLFKR